MGLGDKGREALGCGSRGSAMLARFLQPLTLVEFGIEVL
jgi:hypothetical protein